MTWSEPWVFTHRLSVSHLVTVTSHIGATETTRAKCSWKMGLRHSQAIWCKYLRPMLWVEISARKLMGSFPGKKWGRGRMWSWWFRGNPPQTSLSQHAATWPHMGQRQLLMSCHARSSRPAFIKALGDFRSPHCIWVVLPCLSKLVKQQVADAFWSTGYGSMGCCWPFWYLLAFPGLKMINSHHSFGGSLAWQLRPWVLAPSWLGSNPCSPPLDLWF